MKMNGEAGFKTSNKHNHEKIKYQLTEKMGFINIKAFVNVSLKKYSHNTNINISQN